ncbi:FAD-dependent oxidoreductase [uncultured Rhodoblastus sp.]|uniref:flavin monoamine oxidase family protein n=1 Tax=uncultured Rhodoblastus sp. TaxID=543037 RepID=UPI002600D7C9|nr:FAD-dependent oxidoreductase [uncultured Rhodoblastus sp.]
MSADIDVVIVGAGAAGIAAARRLAPTMLSVLLIEATARVGGRASTCNIANMPLDLGCEWLHSADRNHWTRLAEASGYAIDQRDPAWVSQYRDLGFTQTEQSAASQAFAAWSARLMSAPPPSDCAADALDPDGEWNAFIEAMSGFISGAAPNRLSAKDFVAYDEASTDNNWRAPAGYGALIASSLPRPIDLRLSTPVESIELDRKGVKLETPAGAIRARTALLTVSTAALAGGAIKLPSCLEAWRRAAALLPLGRNEKAFLEIVGDSPFEPETHALGNPCDPRTGSYFIRPFGRPVIECFLGGEGAGIIEDAGPAAGFEYAADQLVALFGSSVRRRLHPLIATCWGRTTFIGGAYSYALPGHAAERAVLARPFEQRIFFAGEATHPHDFSTAHGAYHSGFRAAEEVLAALAPGQL